MKIYGTSGNVYFELDNGRKVKAEGEFLVNHVFLVYKETMVFCDGNKEKLDKEQVFEIESEAKKETENSAVRLEFE